MIILDIETFKARNLRVLDAKRHELPATHIVLKYNLSVIYHD